MVGFGSGSPPAGRPGKRPETRAENWFARHASGPETGPWGRPPRVGQLHPILIVQCYSKTLSPSVSESSSLNWPRSIGGAFFFRSRRAPLLVRRQEGATNWIPSQSPVQDRAERMSIPTPPDGLSMTGPFRYFTVCSKTRGAGPLAAQLAGPSRPPISAYSRGWPGGREGRNRRKKCADAHFRIDLDTHVIRGFY